MPTLPAPRRASRTRWGLLILFLVSCVGCGGGDRPPLGRVTGVITIDGQPAAGVAVLFSHPGFRSSSGLTDAEGRYELKYLKDVMGAVVGSHRVRLDFLKGEATAGRTRLPERYNRKSELKAEVERGSNEINFALDSQ